MLIVNLFGSFAVRSHPDRPIALRSKKAQALLAYLSAHLGQPQPRDKLSALLWPDVDDSQARQSLRQALSSLRRAIDAVEQSALRLEGDTVALDAKAVRADVITFSSLVARGTRHALEEAAGLYRGDLLEGLVIRAEPFEDWLLAERERLREVALEAFARLLAEQAAGGSAEPAIRTALRMLRVDPLQEAVHRALMRLFVRQARRPAALQQYQACVAVLAKELGVAPEPETRDLYQEILRQAPVATGHRAVSGDAGHGRRRHGFPEARRRATGRSRLAARRRHRASGALWLPVAREPVHGERSRSSPTCRPRSSGRTPTSWPPSWRCAERMPRPRTATCETPFGCTTSSTCPAAMRPWSSSRNGSDRSSVPRRPGR